MNRRAKIRLVSFLTALVVALTAWGTTASVTAARYKRTAEISNQRALMRLCEYLDNIETDLTKASYVNSGVMLATLSGDLHKQATGAKTSLSALSSGETQLSNTYKFLSQVGEYTASLNKKAAAGGEVDAKERETLRTLTEFAASLSDKFGYMNELMQSDFLSFEELKDVIDETEKTSEKQVSYLESVSDTEEAMVDFPSLIYDGPFSDNILSKDSEMLKSLDEVPRETAKRNAARLLGAEEKSVADDGESDGRIPTYNFICGDFRVSVTKNGGYLLSILSERVGSDEKVSFASALDTATGFLSKCGYDNMKSTYYATENGVCVINFAFQDGNWLCYPDLIKVGVDLTDGKLVSFDASDFIMNHKARTAPEKTVDVQTALSAVAQCLTAKSAALAVIPTDSGGERAAYEITCEDGNGKTVLVYVDAQTGKEADLLILLFTDGGVLTK